MDVYVASVSFAEAHLSAIVEHVIGGGTGLVYDGRSPARHVHLTADPPPGVDLQPEIDALTAAHCARSSAAARDREARKATRAALNGTGA